VRDFLNKTFKIKNLEQLNFSFDWR